MSYFKALIYALLTAPVILFNVSHATQIQTGDLIYDTNLHTTGNQTNGNSYMSWDLASLLTYAETVAATEQAGEYFGYHIAEYSEALHFLMAAIDITDLAYDYDGNVEDRTGSIFAGFVEVYDSAWDNALFLDDYSEYEVRFDVQRLGFSGHVFHILPTLVCMFLLLRYWRRSRDHFYYVPFGRK